MFKEVLDPQCWPIFFKLPNLNSYLLLFVLQKKSLPNTMIRDYVTAAVPKTPQKHGPFNWS